MTGTDHQRDHVAIGRVVKRRAVPSQSGSPKTRVLENAARAWDTSQTPDLSRLPRTVIPKRYELKVDIYPDDYSYEGEVNIRVYVHEDTSIVWLHAERLHVVEAYLCSSHLTLRRGTSEIVHVPDKSCIGLWFDTVIPAGSRAWIGVRFRGSINRGLEGFFSTPFVDRDTGATRLGAATMFAATKARTCFPCFDEPDMKSVFALEITVQDDLTTISNMPVKSSTLKERRRTDVFEWTKPMSTYLVCFVVGQYDDIETSVNHESRLQTRIRVYTPCGQRENGRFALRVARACLEYFNGYFGKPFPLPKLDFVALSRLSVGAMENWGLITCRETGLIADLADVNPLTLQKIATLIAHEISHQWFGNLVTFKWWDHLYLNEGFATFMQYLCIDAVYPEFEIFNQFCTDTMIPALGMDALEHSHPIEMALKDSSEISQVFDRITYCKGASVINMLHDYMGAEQFKSGIQKYMECFAYSNATTEDLWKVFSEVSSVDVGLLMNNWIRELGFPIVRVAYSRFTDEYGVTFGRLNFKQERLSNSSEAGRHNGLWTIPLKGIYLKDGFTLKKFNFVMYNETAEVVLEGLDLNDPKCWVKVNPNLVGFYRVSYCESSLKNLLSNLDHPSMTSVDRIGLFDDHVAMVLCEGTGETVKILRLAETFARYETSVTVWRSVVGVLHQIRTLTWHDVNLASRYDRFCVGVLKPLLQKMRKLGSCSQQNHSQCQTLLFWHCAIYGDEEARDEAQEMLKRHTDGSSRLSSEKRDAVYRSIMTTATVSVFNQLTKMCRTTDSAEERSRILVALGYSEDPSILDRVLSLSMSEELHAQESVASIISVASNRIGARRAWSYFTQNIDEIVQRYSGGLFLMARLVKAVTESFADLESYQEISSFFSKNERKLLGSEKAVKQALEHVRLNVTWRDRDVASIEKFLRSS